VIELSGDVYPELREQRQHVTSQLGLEEERFGLTLDRGLGKLSKLLTEREEISGADAFSLYDTHGFPVELTIDLVRQRRASSARRWPRNTRRGWRNRRSVPAPPQKDPSRAGLGDRSPEAILVPHENPPNASKRS
jgi:hypothetical protein